jgi:hypothetical protein
MTGQRLPAPPSVVAVAMALMLLWSTAAFCAAQDESAAAPLPEVGAPPEPAADPVVDPVAVEPEVANPATIPDVVPDTARGMLLLGGVDDSHLFQILDNVSLAIDEQEVLLKILYRVQKFNAVDVARWAKPSPPFATLAAEPAEHRAEMYIVEGRLHTIQTDEPPVEVMDRFRMRKYFVCHIQAGDQPVVVVTSVLPKAWRDAKQLDEPVSVTGLFF